jgi:RNA polymerase sigma factor (sigma-70 family)
VTVSINKLKTNKAQTKSVIMEFDRIFQENWKRVYGVVFRIVGDPAEAEDLALGTFLRLHQKPPRDQSNLNGWLYRVATNLALNALRAQNRRVNYEFEAGFVDIEKGKQSDPAKDMEKAQESRQVRKILSRMQKRSAKILVLRYSGFTYAEIAAAIGVSDTSVGTLLSRAEQEFERRYRIMGYDREK